MNSGKGNMILLTIISVSTLLVAVVGATFAYFSATMGSVSPNTIEVTSGSLSTQFNESSKMDNYGANLGDVLFTKTFTVTGVVTGSTNLNYEALINVTNNTYTDGALVYTITSTNTSNNGSTIQATSVPVAIPSGASTITLGNGLFAGPTTTGSTHEYTLTITFANDAENNVGKVFEAEMKVSQTTK
jgi:predicted ribosomally synthesized peptide with SipW-like signal peptide